jgi:hypothetical protein
VFKASDGFGTVAGSYAIATGYLSEQGCRLGIPPGEPGAVDEVGVTVIPPPRRVRVTVTFTAVTVEDGKRFELDQRFDQVLNPSSVLAVEATGEDAGDGPWSVEYAVEVTPLET